MFFSIPLELLVQPLRLAFPLILQRPKNAFSAVFTKTYIQIHQIS